MTQYIINIIIITLLSFNNIFAQNVKVSAKLDSNKILIGDQIKLSLQVNTSGKEKVKWLTITDSLIPKIDIVKYSKIDTIKEKNSNNVTYNQTLIITAFDSGKFVVPAFKFEYNIGNDTSVLFALTQPLYITVNTMKVDTTKAIKDIKPPFEAPLSFKEVLPYIIGGIVLIGIIVLFVYFFILRKKGKTLFSLIKSTPELPAHEVALSALEKLKDERLWQQSKVKLYYTKLTDIVRIYIEKRFDIRAMEMTTEETINAFKNKDINADNIEKLKKTLLIADEVKFAKGSPSPTDNENCIEFGIDFVNSTKINNIENKEEVNNLNNK